jgi:hypothetical protein
MQSSSRFWYCLALCLSLTAQTATADQRLGSPLRLHSDGRLSEQHGDIRLLGALTLSGMPELAELSDIAWDQDEQTLYAVSDRGLLLHLQPVFERQRLVDVLMRGFYPLKDAKGRRLKGAHADAEGLVIEKGNNGIRGDSRLTVSFERKHRIAHYAPDGSFIAAVKLPADLDNPRFYRGDNKGMEALGLHPDFGYLSGPERSRQGGDIPIYSIAQGHRWHYSPAVRYGALVALENYDGDRLLVLERAFKSLLDPLVITLSLLPINAANRETVPPPQRIASFDSTRGWLTQNLEGLARHHGHRYFMVSDDNGESYLQTQLIYFEVTAD